MGTEAGLICGVCSSFLFLLISVLLAKQQRSPVEELKALSVPNSMTMKLILYRLYGCHSSSLSAFRES